MKTVCLMSAQVKMMCKHGLLFLMVLGVFLFIALFYFSGLSLEAMAAGKATGISIRPGQLFQGSVCRVTVHVLPGYRLKTAGFSGRTLVLKEMPDGSYTGIIGAGLREKAGSRELTVTLYSERGGKKILRKRVMVRKKTYPEEHLKVDRKMVEFPPRILKKVLADQKAVRMACSRVTSRIYWDLPFMWPVNSRILSPFGLRRFFNGKPRSPHSGVDLRARTGTPIRAPANGKVVLVRNCYLSGNTVVIDHGGGLFTLYAHLSRVKVKDGEMVRKGTTIGLAGSTGRATGPHLHWGVSLFGNRVDPARLMELFG